MRGEWLMINTTEGSKALFHIGQTVHHRLFEYRGVVFDVDPVFMGSQEWYQGIAKSRPPKDQPWYHVLVHGAEYTTYVAQRNLEQDETSEPVVHPLIDEIFSSLENGIYRSRQTLS
jgi:heat shock protein HspQ